MKKLLLSFLALASLAQAQTSTVIEATTAQAAAGTVGLPYVITPRRQGGGSGAPGTVTSVSVVPSSTVVGSVANPTSTPAITLTAITNPSPTGNNLISGGGVDFVSNLTLTVGAATYTIAGTQYTSPITTLTASAADPTFDRIDVIAVNSSGAAVLIEGTPAATPVEPDVDPTTQLQLRFYILAAGATVLPITTADVYHENLGPPTEWTATKVGAPINLGSTNNPYTGTIDIEGTSAVAGNTFTFTAAADFNAADYNTFNFYCAPKASWPNAKQFSVQLLNSSGAPIGSVVTFKSGTFNFNSAATANAYQLVAIPTSLFGANGQNARAARFTLAGGGSAIGFYFDAFSLQAGFVPPITIAGMNWKGAYSATTAYTTQDTVISGGIQYVAIAASTGKTPVSNPTFWQASTASTGGTVTTVTSTPADGVTLNISTASSTPNITPDLGNITPDSISTTGIDTSAGAQVETANPLAALAIDVTKGLNTKTVAVDSTFTFSGTPANSNQGFTLRLTNSDSVNHVITIPSTFDTNTQSTSTSFTILAGGIETITWIYNGSIYLGYGIPSAGYSAPITVPSATSTPIGAAASINIIISGTTPITSFDNVAAGIYRQGIFSGALTFTQGAALDLPNGGASITTVANDRWGALSLGSGNWRVLWYQRADGTALQGSGSASPLTTKGDVYTYSSADARLAVGSNGSIFMADSAATTGNKWTTPTYPNAATSRKVLIGDGTNIVQSTETYAVPGTSGNVLTSDGTNWLSSTPVQAAPVTTNLGNLTGTINIDWSLGTQFYGTLTGNTTFTFSNAPAGGQTIVIRVLQTGTNTYTVTWPSMGWPGAVAPIMTGSLATRDTYTIIYMNSIYDGSYVQNIH